MRNFHRIIATLLLLAFVPAALVAGQMRLCIGADGHRAVEFAHLSHPVETAHDHGAYAVAVDFHTLDAATLASGLLEATALLESGGCIDLPLVSASVAPSAAAKVQHASSAQPDDGLAASVPARADISRFDVGSTCPRPRLDIADARLEALRTVVLLI